MARSKLHKRYGKRRRKRSSGGGGSDKNYHRNPPLLTDLAEFIGPGFAGFAATRFLTRVASVQLAKKKPSWGKHAGALTSIGAFLAAWWGAGRVKFLAKYQTPIVVGAGIAAIQSIIQLYIPKLGWMITDATTEIESLSLNTPSQKALPADLEYLDDEDPNAYTYNDSYDPGRYANGSISGQVPPSPAATRVAKEDDLLNDLGLSDDMGDLNLGSLGAA